MNYLGNKEFTENGHVMNYYWYECIIVKGAPRVMENKFDMLKILEYF